MRRSAFSVSVFAPSERADRKRGIAPTTIIARVRGFVRRAERGSTEGGSFGDIAFIPFLTGLLMVGVFIALVGFWRVGASFATQLSAQMGAVSVGEGDNALNTYWSWWGGANATGGDFVLEAQNRAVRANVNQSFTFDYMGFGPWSFGIQGQTQSRSERFYPGGPVCSGDCDE